MHGALRVVNVGSPTASLRQPRFLSCPRCMLCARQSVTNNSYCWRERESCPVGAGICMRLCHHTVVHLGMRRGVLEVSGCCCCSDRQAVSHPTSVLCSTLSGSVLVLVATRVTGKRTICVLLAWRDSAAEHNTQPVCDKGRSVIVLVEPCMCCVMCHMQVDVDVLNMHVALLYYVTNVLY